MNRLNRRRFLALGAASTASVVLVACGNESPSEAELNPTQIPDVAGAPPTLAPITSTPSAQQGGGDQAAGGQGGGGEQQAAATAEDAAPPAGGGTVEIEAGDIYYDKTELELAPGQTLVMNNVGMLQHNFVIEDWGDEEVIPLLDGGTSGEWTVPDDVEVGSTVTYYCSVPGHRQAGMEGQLTFVEASAAGGGGEQQAAASQEASAPAEGASSGGGSAEPITIVTLDSLAFDPNEVEVSPGQTITVRNDGFLQHDLAVDAWGGAMVPLLNNGESQDFTIPDDAAVGEQFEYYCTVPGHKEGGMVGTFTIVEASAAAAPAEEEAPSAEAATPEAEAEGTPAATGDQGTPAAAGDASDPANVTVVATEWSFAPADFEAVPGATITLMNEGTVSHGMAAESLGGTFLGPVRAGGTGEFRLPTDLKPGDTIEYTAVNSSAANLGMAGTITIVEGAASASASPAASSAGSPAASPEAAATPVANGGASTGEMVTILALDSLAFDPSELDVSPGQTLTLQNDGFLPHDIAVDAWGGQLTPTLNSGDTAEFTIPEDAAVGESFEYYCTEPGHKEGGMVGTFTIV